MVVITFLKEVRNRQILKPLHCISLSRARLSIGKNSNDALVEHKINDGSDGIKIHLLVVLVLAENIIKLEFLCINILSDAINFVLWLVHYHSRIDRRQAVDLLVRRLLLEQRPLFYAHRNLQLVAGYMLEKMKRKITGLCCPTESFDCSIICWKSTSTFIPISSLCYFLSFLSFFISSIFYRLSSLWILSLSISSRQFFFC
jgi:hypothetical protein